MNVLAIRGALAFGIPIIVLAAVIATTSQSATAFILAAGPVCGIAGGLAYGRRWGLPIVLSVSFACVGAIFLLQDARSADLLSVVFTGLVSAFLFWIAGACAVLTLPAPLRFEGAYALAVPGGIAGMAFQFFYGPGRFVFDLGSQSWWGDTPWEHLIMWLVAGVGGGWLLGSRLERLQQSEDSAQKTPRRSSWAVACVITGIFGLGVAAVSFVRFTLPLGLVNSLSPTSIAADWLRSWGTLTAVLAVLASIETLRKTSGRYGRGFAFTGAALAVVLFAGSRSITADPWKTQFNTNYARKLLQAGGNADAIYKANLILAQAAAETGDTATARQHLLEAARANAPSVAANGPDTTVARVLLQRGEREAVLEYLGLARAAWPQGAAVLTRWEAAIKAGRQPNFNNRSTNQGGSSPERR